MSTSITSERLEFIVDSNFIKDISHNVSEESNSQMGLKENIPGSERVALGRKKTLFL